MVTYDDAVRELYQAPLDRFVAERKRLTGELRAAGEAEAASALAAHKRPTLSAWAVNQLWWHAREDFDELLATAARLRSGELAAQAEHRDATARLRREAANLLEAAGHPASEPTLRRVTTTLAALAAAGGFDPDPPGALAGDREAPGFEAAGITLAAEPAHGDGHPRAHGNGHAHDHAARLRARIAGEAERARRAAEQAESARVKAERHRLEAALRTAQAEVESRERALAGAQQAFADAQRTVTELEAKLAELPDVN